MEDSAQITSPCIGVCQINAKTKFCLGCWRSLREVAHWSKYTRTEKLALLQELRQRQQDAGNNKRRVTRRQKRRTQT
ncbi:MAG: DUF1289 domain-containing protein [Rhodospirillaceae bacterium]|nr:DUF1289 domain-containing protein [Rhodospirillaceae bacterium]MDC0998966.1 DUF1289 domain-containing protein [Alphaproteobacteria bacterium]MBT4353698.1 DUF1289 domain-containing protein [Rhodospirillaceae bacterium]MBT5429841.1 DUF1289 domain-containing protein [Rhodospirillaceae bacterium]MBT5914056.1 DUF1289 domain-containing protein [Rhodospirillaceae bacterium]